ncbi:NAD(P)H-dependent glycerol-3-phosphate dehydrogenase [Aestuariibius insulae]|uniref:NAD(P)H-dependent glycerol-3-phosphate dehydrogenase n=1 Tax=Aestuariibius insulae TaxID=2058287 RepID=UPI00345F01CB
MTAELPSIAVLGAGAFGTALALAYDRAGHATTLWSYRADHADILDKTRQNPRLPSIDLPTSLQVTSRLPPHADLILLACPTQSLSTLLTAHEQTLNGTPLIACCKGIDLTTGDGPTALIARHCPASIAAILTGPSFAAEVARGLPTGLTLACAAPSAQQLQTDLSTPTLRLYRTPDTTGAELGGALKNVIAIACGAAIGAGYGESARASILTRGFAEMTRLATTLGADPATLTGLSGLGDLTLTAMSEQSRNTRFGLALGRGEPFPPNVTVEGKATAIAARTLADKHSLDLPVLRTTAALASGQLTPTQMADQLLARPLKEE